MTNQILQAPQSLPTHEGESFKMLTHTFTTKLSSEATNGACVMYEVTDTVGNGAPLHTHPWDETFYILEGELEIQVGNRTSKAVAGDRLFVPANVAHGFKICSPTVRFLAMMAPALAEAFYREVSERVGSLPQDMPVLQEIGMKHGLTLVL